MYRFQFDYAPYYTLNYYLLNLESMLSAEPHHFPPLIMTKDFKSSKGPRKVHSFPKKHPDRVRRKNNVQGKGKARAIDDVYEYAPSKVRRAKVALSLDRHEIEGRRHDPDDDIDLGGLGQEAMAKLRARLMRDDDDEDGDGRVDSEDDEDIDSEDAFEESDRDEFAGSGFVCKVRTPCRVLDVSIHR